MRTSVQLARFQPVAPPATVRSFAAAKYMPKMRIFAGRIPSSAKSRSASRLFMRSSRAIGPIGVNKLSVATFEKDLRKNSRLKG